MLWKLLHTAALFLLLFAVWCLLSGVFTPLFFSLGAICCLFATFIVLRMEVFDNESHPFQLIYLGPMYWMWLAKEMVVSGLRVTRIIWRLEPNLTPGFAWIRTELKSDLGLTIFANSLTLTPGTVCVDLKKGRAYIHALEESSLKSIEMGEIERRVERITSFATKRGANKPLVEKKNP
ncbi:MAG: cation transporter [Alphaproteobacteria bacterium]|nr:cation transporter [Alphaproteobacteria bacterium]